MITKIKMRILKLTLNYSKGRRGWVVGVQGGSTAIDWEGIIYQGGGGGKGATAEDEKEGGESENKGKGEEAMRRRGRRRIRERGALVS